MSEKLIDGNITIEDKASAALSQIEKALLKVEKASKPVTNQIKQLNAEIQKLKNSPIDNGKIYKEVHKNLKEVPGFNKLDSSQQIAMVQDGVQKAYRQAAASSRLMEKSLEDDAVLRKISSKSEARQKEIAALENLVKVKTDSRKEVIDKQEAGRTERQNRAIQAQKELETISHNSKLNEISAKAVAMKGVLDHKHSLAVQSRREKELEKQQKDRERMMTSESKRTDWQKRMARLQAGGGRLAPLWESFGKATTPLNLARQPHLVTEGFGKVAGNLGVFGKGMGGFVTGRMVGSMLGSSTLGGIIGGAVAGPVGIAISSVGTLLIAGFKKLGDKISDIVDILNNIASERATESTSLRRKMQMSSEMFGVNPTDIKEIDEKIYGLRTKEQEYYKHGMSGRDIVTSAIDWLHLLGTKEVGGVFENEKQVFDFSAALSAIAKMNGLSDREYETVRYQGMQILSKGYADILDIKPLLNSAPGFVRDLLQQTGMTRQELLNSGRTHGFTADKFIDALMNVKDYYEVLSDRASSRTAESQKEAADNIIGAAAIWDEMYNKAKAESNTAVTNAVIQGGIADHIKESWYKMWSDANDAQDGISQKVQFEKNLTYRIWLGINDIYTTWLVIKNIFDLIADTIIFIGKEIYAIIQGAFDMLVNGLNSMMSGWYSILADVPGLSGKEQYKKMAEEADPNSKSKMEERAYDAAANEMANAIIKADLEGGRAKLSTDFPELFNDTKQVGEDITYKTVPAKKEITVIELDADPHMATGWSMEDTRRGYKIVDPDGPHSGMKSKRTYDDWTDTHQEEVRTPIMESIFNEKKLKGIVYTGLDANDETSRAADRTSIVNNLKRELESGNIKLDDATVKKYGLLGGVEDYTWQNIAMKRPGQYLDEFRQDVKQDIDDIKNGLAQREKTNEEARRAFENTKAPYIPKIAKNTEDIKDIKDAVGKGGSQILDILKEIAGVTVINKVTKVRPDVVFNFGSYGRNGKNEDPNLVGPIRELANKLNSLYNDSEQKMSVNGVPVINEAG